MKWNLPIEENLHPGNLACQGCGASLSMRIALKALGLDTIVVIPACCWTVIDGVWPTHLLKVPVFHCAFETAAITASGIKAAKVQQGENTKVMAWAGDGGTFDIGLQSLSASAERNEDIIYVVYDNEAYMNTGIQRSSSTPGTTTTPDDRPKEQPKKNIMEIMAAHLIPYAATATSAFPEDMYQKFVKARDIKGTRFIHILSACPPGWKSNSEDSINIMRLAVKAKVFPLYEIEGGEHYKINYWPDEEVAPEKYFQLQGRFKPLFTDPERLEHVKKFIAHKWDILVKKHEQKLLSSK